MDLIELARRIEGPMRWSESYKVYGEHHGTYTIMGDDQPLEQFTEYSYHAQCLVCAEHQSPWFRSHSEAVFSHFIHCARVHSYIFPESERRLKAEDVELQYIITKSCEFDLPMPGYDDHSRCIKQFKDGKPVCAVHSGNEHKEKRWLGYI